MQVVVQAVVFFVLNVVGFKATKPFRQCQIPKRQKIKTGYMFVIFYSCRISKVPKLFFRGDKTHTYFSKRCKKIRNILLNRKELSNETY